MKVMLTALIGSLALAPQTYSAVFPRGTQVRLVAVSDGTAKTVWAPDGKPLKSNPIPAALRKSVRQGFPGARLFLMQIVAVGAEAPSVAFHVIGGPVRPAFGMTKTKRSTWSALAVANHGGSTADVRIGVADGKWQRLGTVAPTAGGSLKRTGVGFLRMARPDPLFKGNAIIADVSLPVDPNISAYRLRAFDRSGKPMPFIQVASAPGNPLPNRFWFRGAYEAVGRLELQVRPYVWKTFKKVHL